MPEIERRAHRPSCLTASVRAGRSRRTARSTPRPLAPSRTTAAIPVSASTTQSLSARASTTTVSSALRPASATSYVTTWPRAAVPHVDRVVAPIATPPAEHVGQLRRRSSARARATRAVFADVAIRRREPCGARRALGHGDDLVVAGLLGDEPAPLVELRRRELADRAVLDRGGERVEERNVRHLIAAAVERHRRDLDDVAGLHLIGRDAQRQRLDRIRLDHVPTLGRQRPGDDAHRHRRRAAPPS